MRLLVSTLVLTLAWFSALNIVSSLLVWLIAGGLRRGQSFVRPSAQWLFALRVAPFLISSVFAIGVFLPVHLMYEGREGSEYFGALLWSGALLAVGLIGGSALRVVLAAARLRQAQADVGRAGRRETPDRQRLRNPGHLARRYSSPDDRGRPACPRGAYARRAGRGSRPRGRTLAVVGQREALRDVCFTRRIALHAGRRRSGARLVRRSGVPGGRPSCRRRCLPCGQPCICARQSGPAGDGPIRGFPRWSVVERFPRGGAARAAYSPPRGRPHRRAPVLLAVAGWIDGGDVGNDRSRISRRRPQGGAFPDRGPGSTAALAAEFTRGV